MPAENNLEPKLKEALQLTNADWVALTERVGGVWLIRASYKLNKAAQNELMGILSLPSIDAWLSGAISGGYVRSTTIPKNKKITSARFFAFPVASASKIILTGADEQDSTSQRIWKLTASLLADSPAPTQSLLPDLQTGLAFNLPLALEKVLGAFISAVPTQGAWLAIRRGDWLDIQAQWNVPNAANESMPIDENPILRRVNRSLSDVMLSKGQPNWDSLPHAPIQSDTNSWISLPLMIGARLIGVASLWRVKDFSLGERGRLRELAAQISPSVETVVTFSEMTAHLRRLGLLNDFVLTVSSAQNLDQIARRLIALLERAFNTELIALFLRSSDGRVLRDYRTIEGKLNVISLPASGHPIQNVLEDGHVRRISDSSRDEFISIYKDSKSELIAPLKYRGQAMGALIIESASIEAFSQYDERLMVVIASHLAGLIEYTRLREEAEGRARSLGLLHEVVGQVIGLNDKAQVAKISAELVAQYFKYELAVVLLSSDEKEKFSIQGIGGTYAEQIQNALLTESFIKPEGVTGYVTRSGESVLINDTARNALYKPIKGWEAHSELCVAIKDGDEVLGIIDVESRDQNAFSHNDLIAMEALAGILSSVITNAKQYQKLQETIKQLRSTESELKNRMESQRAAEAKLLQAEKMATAGRLSASIAHELNNPLQAVQNCLHLAGREDLPQEKRDEYFKLAQNELERLMVTSRRMLDFYRPNATTLEKVNLADLLQYTLILLSKQITENRIQVALTVTDDDVSVMAVGNQIQQVFINLLLNAADAMPAGGEINITMTPQNAGVEIIFRDSGAGIPQERSENIFEPFFSTKDGGTGLGLTISYNIISAHGGVLELLPQNNSGACFRIFLPTGGAQQ